MKKKQSRRKNRAKKLLALLVKLTLCFLFRSTLSQYLKPDSTLYHKINRKKYTEPSPKESVTDQLDE